MQIRNLDPSIFRATDSYGSVGLSVLGLVRAETLAVTVLRVAPGGEVARHPTVVDQLFIVVEGSGESCGADGAFEPVAPGQAVIWTAGEEHTTRSTIGLAAIVIEAPDLAAFLTR